MLEQAEDAETDAKADLTAAEEQLETLGVDKDHPQQRGSVYAPDLRRHCCAERHQRRRCRCDLSGSSTAFTIADLSVVWIICDVYENDIPKIHLGQASTDQAQRLSRSDA